MLNGNNDKYHYMGHLEEEGFTYFEHLQRAWTLSFVCFVHGLFPFIWKHKATEIIKSKWPIQNKF